MSRKLRLVEKYSQHDSYVFSREILSGFDGQIGFPTISDVHIFLLLT